jgi:hypothetical protein
LAEFVTRQEFEMVKAKQDELIIRVEAIDRGLASLTVQVAELSESMERRFDAVDRRFDAVDRRFDAVDQRFDRLEKKVDDCLTALMSIVQIGRR